jgi:hypothetical protein
MFSAETACLQRKERIEFFVLLFLVAVRHKFQMNTSKLLKVEPRAIKETTEQSLAKKIIVPRLSEVCACGTENARETAMRPGSRPCCRPGEIPVVRSKVKISVSVVRDHSQHDLYPSHRLRSVATLQRKEIVSLNQAISPRAPSAARITRRSLRAARRRLHRVKGACRIFAASDIGPGVDVDPQLNLHNAQNSSFGVCH